MCSGYHHVIVAEESQTLLAFSWEYSDGIVEVYVFVGMPFGWAPAAYVFYLYFKPSRSTRLSQNARDFILALLRKWNDFDPRLLNNHEENALNAEKITYKNTYI